MPFVTRTTCCLFCLLALLAGCSSRQQIRHLASDACLVTPNKTSRQEIQAYFGPPDKKQSLHDGREEWTYFQQNKSLLRKTPYIGSQLGSENYDVMVVTFQNDTVTTCQYRMFSETEFKESHIDDGTRRDAD